jgi:hypothetical protein
VALTSSLSSLQSHSISLLCPLSPFTLTHLSSLISFFSSLDLPLASRLLPSCPLALLRSCPLTRRPFPSYLLPHVFHLQPLTSLLSPLIVCGLCYANSDVERTIYLTTESHKGVVTRATARRRFSPLGFHLPISSLSCPFSPLSPTPPPAHPHLWSHPVLTSTYCWGSRGLVYLGS